MQRDLRPANHYEWFSGFLEARRAALPVRLFVAATTLSMAIALLVLLIGAGGPREQPQQAMTWLAIAGGVVGVAPWLWRWPSRMLSGAYAAVTTASIALACLAYPDPLAALLGCIAFTTIGAFLAFFHSYRAMFGLFLVAGAVTLSRAIELAAEGRIALAAVDFFLVLQANVAMPLAIHTLLIALKGDLAHAELDPLTGLLNRRAFRKQTLSLVEKRSNTEGYLLVAVLDLDNFKKLNDTRGHSVGDQALVAVAGALRATATPTAVVTRSGGEEFTIADVTYSYDSIKRFEDVCDAIARLPIPVTASVGTAIAALDGLPEHGHGDAVDLLVTAADMAMYRAKRNGGNQCHHHGLWLAPGSAP